MLLIMVNVWWVVLLHVDWLILQWFRLMLWSVECRQTKDCTPPWDMAYPPWKLPKEFKGWHLDGCQPSSDTANKAWLNLDFMNCLRMSTKVLSGMKSAPNIEGPYGQQPQAPPNLLLILYYVLGKLLRSESKHHSKVLSPPTLFPPLENSPRLKGSQGCIKDLFRCGADRFLTL